MKLKCILLASIATIYSATGTAAAQQAPELQDPQTPSPVATEEGLSEILVTAQRRSERLQDVPFAITAVNGDALAVARVENITNVDAISPSVSFRTANIPSSTSNLIVRGLGTTGNTRSFEGSVGVFIDGVYRSRAAAALQNFLDIDSLQLLRGPQGTLFGKNTSAGAVLLTSTAPNFDDIGGNASFSYANYDQLIAKAAVNLPLSDRAAVRVAGVFSNFDGYYKDVNNGGRLNGNRATGLKAQLALRPTDSLNLRLIVDYSRSSGSCCYATVDFVNGPTQPLVDALTVAAGNVVPSRNVRDFQSSLNTRGRQVVKDYGATLLADLEVGNGTLKSITAFRRFQVGQTEADADFSGADILPLDESFSSHFASQEINYSGKIEPLGADYVLGAFVSDEKTNIHRRTSFGTQAQQYWDALGVGLGLPPGFFVVPAGVFQADHFRATARSYALFAHFEVPVSERFSIAAGARYSIEKKTGSFEYVFNGGPRFPLTVLGLAPAPTYNARTTDKALGATFALQYKPSTDVMLYASYNRGFKAGGVNLDTNAAGLLANNPAVVPGAVPLSPVFRPEYVDAYEIGAKLQYFDRRARTNIALFHYDLSDIQIADFSGLQFTVFNAKKAKLNGLEVESTFQLLPSLTLSADVTYIPKAKFGVDAALSTTLSGARFRYASKFQGNATIALDQPISGDLNVTGRVQYQYSSPQFINTRSNTQRDQLHLLNANLGIKNDEAGWSIEAFVQNLTNRTYPTYSFAPPLQAGDENAYLGAPRTYGLLARFEF